VAIVDEFIATFLKSKYGAEQPVSLAFFQNFPKIRPFLRVWKLNLEKAGENDRTQRLSKILV
jgi:hypothetical protein